MKKIYRYSALCVSSVLFFLSSLHSFAPSNVTLRIRGTPERWRIFQADRLKIQARSLASSRPDLSRAFLYDRIHFIDHKAVMVTTSPLSVSLSLARVTPLGNVTRWKSFRSVGLLGFGFGRTQRSRSWRGLMRLRDRYCCVIT